MLIVVEVFLGTNWFYEFSFKMLRKVWIFRGLWKAFDIYLKEEEIKLNEK